jgi:hypothetical protein
MLCIAITRCSEAMQMVGAHYPLVVFSFIEQPINPTDGTSTPWR